MGYRLAVDMGTTFTAAAAVETGHENPSMHELGNRAVQIPSVLYLQEDGQFLVGRRPSVAARRIPPGWCASSNAGSVIGCRC